MSEQPDKLFHDKLHGYQKPVAPEVWKRISEAGPHRTRQIVWIRAAASILIITAAGMLLYPLIQHDRAPVAHTDDQTAPAPQSTSPTESLASESQSTQENETEKDEASAITVTQSALAKNSPLKRSSGISKQTTSEEPHEIVESAVPAQEPQVTAEHVVTANLSPESPASAQRKTVTIVFTAEEVNQKYLSGKNEAHATSDEKQPSTLRNLLDKAQELKHNQDPLGEIRQKKDEILAMNFRKDKQRTEKN